MSSTLEELQIRLGYRFRDPQLLRLALTHSSFSNETGAKNHHLLCNERLEFLGDSVLSIITSDYLYKRFPNEPEGTLTRLRAATVCEEALASYSEELHLGEALYLGKGESQTGGAKKPAIIADAFEATLAAIYLDAGGLTGGMDAASAFLMRFLPRAVDALSGLHTDFKSRLQEFLQEEHDHSPEYRVVGESGPDHDKTFTVEVYLGSNRIGTGTGHSKKQAEQKAAAAALELFDQLG